MATAEKTNQSKPVKTRVHKKKRRKVTLQGIATIQATFNNTIVSIAEQNGDVIAWSSAGSEGFKGTRKSTPYAAQVAARTAATKAVDLGMKAVDVIIRGIGVGRESAIRSLATVGLEIISITDATPIPHNGCRRPKPRRV